jgi:signal peptidase I
VTAASNDNSDMTQPVTIVSTKGKQFIKRVVGVPGESVGVYNSNPYVVLCNKNTNDCKFRVDETGQYSRPDIFSDESWNRDTPSINTNFGAPGDNKQGSSLGKNEFFVAGDNGYRSVDSRVWGPLNRNNIFGTAQFIVFPPARAGMIPNGNIHLQDVLQ